MRDNIPLFLPRKIDILFNDKKMIYVYKEDKDMKKIIIAMLIMVTMMTGCGIKEQAKYDFSEFERNIEENIEAYKEAGVEKIDIYELDNEYFVLYSGEGYLSNWAHMHSDDVEYSDEEFVNKIKSLTDENIIESITI